MTMAPIFIVSPFESVTSYRPGCPSVFDTVVDLYTLIFGLLSTWLTVFSISVSTISGLLI